MRLRVTAGQATIEIWKRRSEPCRLLCDPNAACLEQNRRLRYAVERKLCREWSPEQVSGWLKNRYADNEAMPVSHETIYRSLFVQARGVLKKELQYHLRTQRKMRHSRFSSTKGARNKIADAVSIHELTT